MSTTRTLSDLLIDAATPYGRLIERSRFHRELQTRLEGILGADMAAHFYIQNLRDGVLILQTEASSWAARLRFQLPALLKQLRATPGLQQLRDIQIRIAQHERPRVNTPRRAHMSREAAAVLASAAEATQDPQLRDALMRLARKGDV